MEILFVIICIAIALAIPFFTGWIRKPRTASLVSRLYSIIAYGLFVTSAVLFVGAGRTSCDIYEACLICGGSGIESSGTQCMMCQGAGEILVSQASYSISWLYPSCLIILGLYIAIFSLALKTLTDRAL